MSPEKSSSPYAIVKTGGKQYRVQPGQRLLVERLAAEEGKSVTLQPLMYRAEEIVCDGDALAKVKVTAKVIAHERGEKLRVFKFKPKRGYRRRNGHRQELTRIEVTEISLGSARKKTVEKQAADASAAEKPADEGKAAVTQAAEKPKTAAKPKAPADKAKPPTAEKPKESSDGS